MPSILFNEIASRPITNETDNMEVRAMPVRDVILCLPSIPHLARNMNIVPPIDIKIIFSKSARILPNLVTDHLNFVSGETLLRNENLLGLCLNGRGPDPEIFVHSALFEKESQLTGYVFDDIVWHELLHAIEGFRVSKDGTISRDTPLSYYIQQEMIKFDEEYKSSSKWHQIVNMLSKEHRNHLEYLRAGTPAQDNVSELFARLGNLFLQQIRMGVLMPSTRDELRDFFSPTNLYRIRDDNNPAAGSNVASEIITILDGFSLEAVGLLFHPEVYTQYLNNFTRIYGYDYFADKQLKQQPL
jgi:hypothetical protein